MRNTNTIVVGGGQAGLAVSWYLRHHDIDHVVLERGRIGERWRSERWDSLRLLTPNWQTRLPGWSYCGPDPDGFMTVAELASYLEGYARSFGAPVESATTVIAAERHDDGYRLTTDHDAWSARNVIVATGQFARPFVPDLARALSRDVHQLTPSTYRNPGQLPGGGVLVVGASASGLQIADELCRAGRAVMLAVGSHKRLPRRYRGRDIMYWLDRSGQLTQPVDEHSAEARRQPSVQLIGRHEERFDLGTVQDAGVVLAGRIVAVDRHRVMFDDNLTDTLADADAQLQRTLDVIDRYIEQSPDAHSLPSAIPVPPVIPRSAPTWLDLRAEGIGSVVWATGFRPENRWLAVPVIGPSGEIRQRHGVTPSSGLYTVGTRFQTSRASTSIDGAGEDARRVVEHLVAHRDARRSELVLV